MYFGDQVQLTHVEPSDAKTILQYFNDTEFRLYVENILPFSVEEEEQFIRTANKQIRSQKSYFFAIRTLDGELIGTCGVGGISPIHQTAGLGIGIFNKEYWGKGLGTDAMRTLCAFSFHGVNLHRLELEVHDFNQRAYQCYIKIGFKEVGRLRKKHFISGQYHDSIIMDFLRDEFYQLYEELDLTKPSPWKLVLG